MSTKGKSHLEIINAGENNLKGFDIEIPHDQVVVLTGVSGSGKSSLAFDTVYAEGQRRYIETFSPYTRQFFDKVKKPVADSISNLRPAIAIQQRTRITSSRSTVGSMTNVNDFLRIIWANLGSPVCPNCERPLERFSAEALYNFVKRRFSIFPDEALLVCFKKKLSSKKDLREALLKNILEDGYSRYVDPKTGEAKKLGAMPPKELIGESSILLILDRVASLEALSVSRFSSSVKQAYAASRGECIVVPLRKNKVRSFLRVEQSHPHKNISPDAFLSYRFTESYSCGDSVTLLNPKPSLFNSNHPSGACPECKGFGKTLEIDPELCVPDKNLSIEDGAIQCWTGKGAKREFRKLLKLCEAENLNISIPWKSLPEKAREQIFNSSTRTFTGIYPWFKKLDKKKYKMHVRVFLSRYRKQVTCKSCKGSRLVANSLSFRINGLTISDALQFTIEELHAWLSSIFLSKTHSSKELEDIFKQVLGFLEYLSRLGLPYLSLNREAKTLSGGETQRVNLATALGSNLVSTQFVLDEPSVGLHPRDTARLIEAVHSLSDKGNSLLVVEHDPDFIASAETLIEMGPKSGVSGGEIVYLGNYSGWAGKQRLLQQGVPLAEKTFNDFLCINGAKARNLKNLSIRIPVGSFSAITGVSGSGKSTLVSEVILHAQGLREKDEKISDPDSFKEIIGLENFDAVLLVDQAPLARSPRANVATYSGVWEKIRTLLANTDSAIQLALTKSSFSFNVDAGRCTACKGAGFIREDMQFLSDMYVPCEICGGRRFQRTVLDVRLYGSSVDEILSMTVLKAKEHFSDHSDLNLVFSNLELLGLGHLTIGHPLSELSGGEAQRLKLIPFVAKSKTKDRALLIFDEPTTGLHTEDILGLISLLRELQNSGHTIVCVEHNLFLISHADWIVDLGPEGGDRGGYLLYQGSPKDFSKCESETAKYLDDYGGQKSDFSKSSLVKNKQIKGSALLIKGAKEHNLKNIDLDVPLNKLVAITGVSGSGKSTIAKDIIYAEGQRRYLDCLSPYARQFIKELKKPDIEAIENIPPTICVYQRTFQPSQRSTVGTLSEAYNYLRLLFAKNGTQYCPDHPKVAIRTADPKAIAIELSNRFSESVRVLAPVVKSKKGLHRDHLQRAVSSDISELRIDGIFLKSSNISFDLDKRKVHSIDFVVARCNPSTTPIDMLEDAVHQALSLGGGTLIIHSKNEEVVFSSDRSCPECKRGFFKLDPEDFSFHSKRGACSRCGGSGLEKSGKACKACDGKRLNEIARNVRIGTASISDIAAMNPLDGKAFLLKYYKDPQHKILADSILKELYTKYETLSDIGLDYVPLDRNCLQLSGGELQRLRLSAAIGSPLTGAMYIFDEPSAGLHPSDNLKVLKLLRSLYARGNSVMLIEHDAQSILSADHIIDIGPSGGRNGGEVTFNGSIKEFLKCENSATSRIILQNIPMNRNVSPKASNHITIKNGCSNNVQNLNAKIPLNQIVCIAGISGAGKSSLLNGIIVEGLTNNSPKRDVKINCVEASTKIDRLLYIDQKPIGANSRSTPASYLGIWDPIRKLFSESLEARTAGLKPGYFSYNTGKGRCSACKGLGFIRMEMSFLAEAQSLCEECGGGRYSDEALNFKYLGKSIAEVLNLTFEEARSVFANHRKIHLPLHAACELGLGYLQLGQSSTTLSGGESQRVKLSSELVSPRKGHTLYLLDEPTLGLHLSDIEKLMKTLRSLVAAGHSVYIIEHESRILMQSDYIIEMGPGPGDAGGKIVYEGPPSKLPLQDTAWGFCLAEMPLAASTIANSQVESLQ